MCTCTTHTNACAYHFAYGGHRTTCKSQFSPPTCRSQELNSGHASWHRVSLPEVLFHLPSPVLCFVMQRCVFLQTFSSYWLLLPPKEWVRPTCCIPTVGSCMYSSVHISKISLITIWAMGYSTNPVILIHDTHPSIPPCHHHSDRPLQT